MATIYSVHYIPKFVFLENVCRVLLHPLPIRHADHLIFQGVDSSNEPMLTKNTIQIGPKCDNKIIKETVSVISSPFKFFFFKGHVKFTTVPIKALSDQV